MLLIYIGESLFTSFCLINIHLLSSDEANKITPLNVEKKNFSHLCKFEPEKPNSFGEILFEKSQYLQRMYDLINGFATPQFRSFKLLLFPFVIDYKELKLAQSAQIDQLFQLLNLIITNYLCIRQRPLCWDILYANEQKFKQ